METNRIRLRPRKKGQPMSAFDAYEKTCEYLGQRPRVSFASEYEHVIGFRMRPGEMLCVIKDTGEVVWGNDLPDELAPTGIGKTIVIGKNWE